ncbi:MAG: single-stranded DNA-binding protein [Lachnospiraceae bacterium]|nr:single-stranded DNA-binding protein [Lachnospiraceae bacterium]
MNKVILMGRLVDDPEIYDSPEGDAVGMAKFRLAVDRRFKKKNDDVTADFFGCVAFGRGAEFVDQYLRKAVKIVVVGRIENFSYKNQEGRKVFGTQIIAEEFEFAESKAASERSRGESGSAGDSRSSSRPVRQRQEADNEEYPPEGSPSGGRRSAESGSGTSGKSTGRNGNSSGRQSGNSKLDYGSRQGDRRTSTDRKARSGADDYSDIDPYTDFDGTDKPVFE